MPGTLYLVSTPIGNLEDITYRAVKVLSSVSLIAAEDTRHSKKLLNHYNIKTPITSYHDHNKEQKSSGLIKKIFNGDDIAVISDAGTPGISDPGFYITREALRHEITVSPIPGATSIISALVGSGLPTDSFIFEGFLPVKKGKRTKVLNSFKDEKRTVIFLESPFRIVKTLQEIKEALGELSIVIARELTKKFEEFLRGTPTELITHFESKKPKGEIVVMLNQNTTLYHIDIKKNRVTN